MTEEQIHRPPAGEERFDAWLTLTRQMEADGDVRLPLLTGSMLPALPVGSTLVITPGDAGRARRGDVVVFSRDDRLVAHRVLWRLRLPGRDLIFEKGDSNPRGSWIPARRIRGVVREAVLPDGERRAPGDTRAATRSLRHLLQHMWRGRRDEARREDDGDGS